MWQALLSAAKEKESAAQEVDVVMRTLGARIHKATSSSTVRQLMLLSELQLDDEAEETREELAAMLEMAKELAEGAAGDSPKYVKAAKTLQKHWELFLTIKGYATTEPPTVTMAEEFATFLFKTRLRRSREGKTGHGDSSALLARYALVQLVFPRMGYDGWCGLSKSAMKQKAQPYSEAIKETWVRLRRSQPEMQSSAKPFVKEKWDDLAVMQVQDAVYAKMDAVEETLNSGLTRLMVIATVRSTCSRPGALGKDAYDLEGLTVWGPDGKNVLSTKNLTWSRKGMKITLPDGTVEETASRAQLKMERLKHKYFEAQAGGYKYDVSVTPDALAVARRSADIMAMYQFRRGLYAVQYAGMTEEAKAEAITARSSGYSGGMPPGAVISEEEAVARWVEGEKSYLKELEDEPLIVMMHRGGENAFKTSEVTTAYVGSVFKTVAEDACFKPGSGGVNNMRRSGMVAAQKGAERQGFDPSMHAKRLVNHRSDGHSCREGVYEDCTATTDMGAFLMNRPAEQIEALGNLSTTRCPELAKYRKPSDVSSKDPLWSVLKSNEELKALRSTATRLAKMLEKGGATEGVASKLQLVEREKQSLDAALRRQVLWDKQNEVYARHLEALQAMPLEEVKALEQVNSYEGVTLQHLLLRYGCGAEVPFEVDSIVQWKKVRGKKESYQYLVKWCGYKDAHNSWEDEANVPKAMRDAAAAKEANKSAVGANDQGTDTDPYTIEQGGKDGGRMPAAPTVEACPKTVPTPVPATPRKAEQKQEEVLALLYADLVKESKTKVLALQTLAGRCGGMSVRTLRKKIERANERMATSTSVDVDGVACVRWQGREHIIKYSALDTMEEVHMATAAALQLPSASMRLVQDGERVDLHQCAAQVVQGSEQLVLDVFTEVKGGGDGSSQEEGIELEATHELEKGGTQPLSDAELEEGGTQPPSDVEEGDAGARPRAAVEAGSSWRAPIDLALLDDDALRARLRASLEALPDQLQADIGAASTGAYQGKGGRRSGPGVVMDFSADGSPEADVLLGHDFYIRTPMETTPGTEDAVRELMVRKAVHPAPLIDLTLDELKEKLAKSQAEAKAAVAACGTVGTCGSEGF